MSRARSSEPASLGQADEVVAIVREVLGDDVLGAYLHGSAVLGGLRPTSDVDVLVVTRRSATRDERRAVVERLMAISGRRARLGPTRPVELTVLVASEVRPWRYPPTADLQYGEWLRDEYEQGAIPEAETSPDLALLVTMVLLGDRPLIGPAPAALLDPVPPADLRRALLAGVPGLLADLEDDTRNVVLTFARIWTTLATGEIRSKDTAADWALARLPAEHRAVLARARELYLAGEHERWEDLRGRIRPHVDHVVREIETLGAST